MFLMHCVGTYRPPAEVVIHHTYALNGVAPAWEDLYSTRKIQHTEEGNRADLTTVLWVEAETQKH